MPHNWVNCSSSTPSSPATKTSVAPPACHHPAFAGADAAAPHRHRRRGTGADPHLHRTILLADEAGTVRRLAVRDGGDAVHNPFAGQFVPRNSPTIINSALLPQQFWDGRVQSYARGAAARSRPRSAPSTIWP
ncbi:MAG: cytochrome c peroxidase [Caldilineaceae bacterium]